ncbi:ABC transporter ATP-binding protein [Leucobacter luti]|uniref:ABC transporter ATP-binding protein n=1 Tax=Leucobacter luti TaxID=340320 RepID=UPI003D0490F3
MSENFAVLAEGLEKRFGRVRALDGLDLSVRFGEVHGFLGPNGAGKSTTIRILLGLARRSGGTATVFGLDPWEDAVEIHRRIASVPGDVSIWPNLTGGEAIDLIARLRGVTHRDQQYLAERERLCSAFLLDPRKKGRSYSKGNRQKVALVAALAVPAELYVFDEPTSGLDPLMESVFREEVVRLRERGAAVLLSSHILSEVEQLCDRISIIKDGRTVESGTLAELGHFRMTEVSFSGSGESLRGLDGVSDYAESAGRTSLTLPADRVALLLPEIARIGARDLRVAPPTLESLFLHHYGKDPATVAGKHGGS